MLHPDSSTAPARPRRLTAAALAFVLVSLLVLAAGPAAPIGEAAKGPSITIQADHQTVKAGDNVTLKIKLQNVNNATLNGTALPADKDSVQKKVLICATTTYTVTAMPKDGSPKISQALTITASGTTTKAACASPTPAPAAVTAGTPAPLPDLAVTSLTVSQWYDPKDPKSEYVSLDYTIANLGQAPAENTYLALYINGKLDTEDPAGALKAGAKTGGNITFWKQDSGGSYTYSLVVDPDNKIVEADKTNNSKTAGIVVVQGTNPLGGVIGKFDKLNQSPDIFKLKP